MTTSTGVFSPKPSSIHSNSLSMKRTRRSRTIVALRMLLSPIKSATKALHGSL